MTGMAHRDGDLVGKVLLGRYRILRHLADGGMGAIYLARSEGAAGFMRPVVVKCLLPSRVGDDYLLQMFMREARIMSTLRHPGIVSVIDFAVEDETHVMVMEYVHGFHLGRWHRFAKRMRQEFPIDLAVHIVVEVLGALHYAHTLKGRDNQSLNIIHRDVTPSNVLIDVEGHVKLADFGIARIDTEKTAAGDRTIKGKVPYLAPEILADVAPSPASDVYSAALVLHELIVGRNEFRQKEVAAIVTRVLRHVPSRIDETREVPAGLADVVAKGLAKEPEERFRSAAEFAAALISVRRTSQEEGARVLRESAERDFLDPRMAALLALPQLDELESSWTTPSGIHTLPELNLGAADPVDLEPEIIISPSPGDDVGTVDTRVLSEEEQVGLKEQSGDRSDELYGISSTAPATSTATGARRAARAASSADAAEKKRNRGPLLIAVGAVALTAVAAVSVVALLSARQSSSPTDPRYIVVRDRNPAEDDSAARPVPADAMADEAEATPDAAVSAPLHPQVKPQVERPPETSAARLAKAFGKQKGKITACFREHAMEIAGAPEIAVRFVVDREGKVVSASLIPPELAETEVGRCLVAVAVATRFGPQSREVSFRVPLKARTQ